ncbi:MAG TPA: hypothetical protein VFA50_09830 [Stellaceae bacterium]|nr:hypothetical protein [Stellaceae bacterium]
MNANTPLKPVRVPPSLKAHALGLLGANLAIGTLALWGLPLVTGVSLGSIAAGTSAPPAALWNIAELPPLLGHLLAVALILLGLGLIGRAARMLAAAPLAD